MPTIERLTLETVPYAVQLACELHGQGSLHGIKFEHGTTAHRFIHAVSNPNWHFQIAKDDDDVYCGAMVGHVDTFLFSNQLLAIENAIYVREGTKMRTRIAVKMARNFVSWALDEKGATHVQGGDIAGINPLAIHEFYRHLGFVRFGTIYKFSRPGSVV